MDLTTARNYAEKIAEWIAPHTERWEIAGSIRRECVACNDVDIVCIPKLAEKRDLFNEVVDRSNLLWQFMREYADKGEANIRTGGEREGKQMMIDLKRCQLDLWFTDEATWATRLVCRTGSVQHNIRLVQRAESLGMKWNPYEGVEIAGEMVRPASETALYEMLRLPFIPPTERQPEQLDKWFGK